MTGRVEEDAETRVGLELRLAGAQGQNPLLRSVEIVDVEVEVSLLRPLCARPRRRNVIGRELEGERDLTVAAQLYPVVVAILDLAAGDGAVEAGQGPRVTAVEGHGAQSSD